MDKKHKLLKKYIKEANNILIISHLGPDPDAFCSMLLLKEAIRQIYPNKIVKVKARQMPNFNIPTMKDIEVVERLDEGDEDLIIITDMTGLKASTKDDDALRTTKKRVVAIDHHMSKDDIVDLTINEHRSSAAEQVYVTIKRIFSKKLEITPKMAEITQYGILADTHRFLYSLTTPETLRIYADLQDISPVDVENFTYKSEKIPEEAVLHIKEYLNTLTIVGDMAYMYNENNNPAVESASEFIVNNILRYIYGVHWGFTVTKGRTENKYKISFRSTNGYQKVRKFAEELGGGGHDLASGADTEAPDIQTAVDRVLEVIDKLKD